MDRLVRQLKQRVPIAEIGVAPWLASHESQELLTSLLETFIIPQNSYYAKQFLQKLIEAIERDPPEEDYDIERCYELYMKVISSAPLSASIPELVFYALGPGSDIKIRETPRLINGSGSTGFRTWEACLYLAEFIVLDLGKSLKPGSRLLELGAGTGLLSLTVMKNFGDKVDQIFVSDGDPGVFIPAKANFRLNDIDLDEKIQFTELLWGKEYCKSIPNDLDFILAADVTYDSTYLKDLVETLEVGLAKGVAFIAATVRNEKTVSEFENELQNHKLNYTIVKLDPSPGTRDHGLVLFPKHQPEIRIYQITKQLT